MLVVVDASSGADGYAFLHVEMTLYQQQPQEETFQNTDILYIFFLLCFSIWLVSELVKQPGCLSECLPVALTLKHPHMFWGWSASIKTNRLLHLIVWLLMALDIKLWRIYYIIGRPDFFDWRDTVLHRILLDCQVLFKWHKVSKTGYEQNNNSNEMSK